MFAPGDYVIYSVEGVCRVDEAGQLNVPGLERGRSYYRLTPYYRGGVIYTPVDGKAAIRPVMTKPALQALLPELPGMPELENVPQDPRQLAGFYREILASHDCRRLLQLCKTMFHKQRQLAPKRKTVSSTELRSWKTARGDASSGVCLRPRHAASRGQNLSGNSIRLLNIQKAARRVFLRAACRFSSIICGAFPKALCGAAPGRLPRREWARRSWQRRR